MPIQVYAYAYRPVYLTDTTLVSTKNPDPIYIELAPRHPLLPVESHDSLATLAFQSCHADYRSKPVAIELAELGHAVPHAGGLYGNAGGLYGVPLRVPGDAHIPDGNSPTLGDTDNPYKPAGLLLPSLVTSSLVTSSLVTSSLVTSSLKRLAMLPTVRNSQYHTGDTAAPAVSNPVPSIGFSTVPNAFVMVCLLCPGYAFRRTLNITSSFNSNNTFAVPPSYPRCFC